VVAPAARATLASGTARVWQESFFHPPEARLERFVTSQEGVTDLAARRTRTEQEVPSFLGEWAARTRERYPWLDGDDSAERNERERPRPVIVYAGTAEFFGIGDRWSAAVEGDHTAPARGTRDPLWIVEALTYADQETARAADVVRGVTCERWEFRVDPALHHELRTSGPERIAGDAWVDPEGRLRRVTWTRLARGRPRWPRKASPRHLWHTTELWDFGVPVEIEVPTVAPEQPTPWPIGVVQIAWELWRRRRAYRRNDG
jgi:hypothetical protein